MFYTKNKKRQNWFPVIVLAGSQDLTAKKRLSTDFNSSQSETAAGFPQTIGEIHISEKVINAFFSITHY